MEHFSSLSKTPHKQNPAQPGRKHVEIDFDSYVRRRRKPNPSLRAKTIRALAGFLILMVLFTLLSRAADELTIAKVKAVAPEKRSIEHSVSASGKVMENGTKAVTALGGIRVADVPVKAGESIKKDGILFTFDMDDLREKLEEAKKELEKIDLDISDQQNRTSSEAQDRSKAISRAEQDYADAKKEADKAVSQAQESLNTAQARLDEYRKNQQNGSTREQLQLVCQQKDQALKDAESALAGLQEEIEQKVLDARAAAGPSAEEQQAAEDAVRTEYQSRLDSAGAAVDSARQEKQAADDALNRYSGDSDGAQEQALADAVTAARQGYEQAVTSRDSSLKAASRALEDARQAAPADSTAKRNQLTREEQEKKVEKIQAMIDAGGNVRAPIDSVVTKLEVSVGNPAPEGMCALLADTTTGSQFVAQVPADQEKYLERGGEVTLKPGGDQKDITGLTIDSIQANAENPDLLDVTVRLPADTLEIGAAAVLETTMQSKTYPVCVPLSALHEENGSYYLLIPQENQSILGSELTAARLNVEILEKNDSYAALTEFSILPDQKFITESSKSLEAGDRVRLKEA